MSTANKCSWLISLCGCVFLLAVTFGAVGYAMGWIDFADEPETTTIEIDKKELKADAKEAAKATEEFFEGETLQEATDESMEREESARDDEQDAAESKGQTK